MFILDTNVVSELRKVTSGKANKNVVRWAQAVPPTSFFLSVISILELETGILLMERKDEQQGKILRSWFDLQVLPAFAGRILNLDMNVAQHCAALHVPDRRSDRDSMIAATAMVHSMTVVTRNVEDFIPTKVAVINPWVIE